MVSPLDSGWLKLFQSDWFENVSNCLTPDLYHELDFLSCNKHNNTDKYSQASYLGLADCEISETKCRDWFQDSSQTLNVQHYNTYLHDVIIRF